MTMNLKTVSCGPGVGLKLQALKLKDELDMKFIKKWLSSRPTIKRDLSMVVKLVVFALIMVILAFFIDDVSERINIL